MSGAFRSRWSSFIILGFAVSPLLSACGGGETVGEALGYELAGPDEMAVIRRPPLTVPPDFNLRPPRSGDAAIAATEASQNARRTLIGAASAAKNGSASKTPVSEGQNLLVSRSDRTELNLDELNATRAENRVDSALLRRLLAWSPDDGPAPTPSEDTDSETAEPATVVKVVDRSQTVIDTTPDPDTKSAE